LLEVLDHRIGSPKLAEPIEHSCDDRPTDGGARNDDAAPDEHEGPTDRLSGEHHQTTGELGASAATADSAASARSYTKK
jgi:hypothetical protein